MLVFDKTSLWNETFERLDTFVFDAITLDVHILKHKLNVRDFSWYIN